MKKNFVSVSTNAARLQDISLNPQKLAGMCAKLKCCLNYEVDDYMEASRKMPSKEITLFTQDNEYFLFKTDILAGLITYSTQKGVAANLETISYERAKEVIELKAADGKDYSALFSAKYNSFAVLDMTYQASAEAAPVSLKGASLGEFVADAPVVITTNYDNVTGNDSISYVTYDVFDLNAAEGDEAYVVTKTHIENHTDAGWKGEVVGAENTKLYLGHTYRVVVTGYQQIGKYFNPYRDIVVGTDTLYFSGSEPDYVYSDITLDSFTPADSTISSADDFKLTLNYSGLVKIKQDKTGIAGGNMREFIPFTAYEAVEPDSEGYSN